jgi:pyruvate/2-oxoglutarate dehydrogenase complex dihydrolipoamide dehydrogenase (E3) component
LYPIVSGNGGDTLPDSQAMRTTHRGYRTSPQWRHQKQAPPKRRIVTTQTALHRIKTERRPRLSIVFSDPQVMLAGETRADLFASGTAFESGEVSFADDGGLRVHGEAGTGRFLGAEMVGPGAEHIGHLLAWSLQRGDTVQQMLEGPFHHPVVEERLRTALRRLQAKLAFRSTSAA